MQHQKANIAKNISFVSKCAYLLVFICALAIAMPAANSFAGAIKAKQYGVEGRFKTWTYYPNTVYQFTGYYLNPTYIEFADQEKITTISTPKPTAWQFVPNSNRLFLKPVENDADTTAIIMTNKRIYFFELLAEEADGPFDPNVAFFVKFRYPKQADGSGQGLDDDGFAIVQFTANEVPDLSHPELYNFNYTMSGDEVISPIAVFDDGQFTYMKFAAKGGVIPAVFAVDSQGFEELVNYRMVGPYMMVEKISSIFTLRNGAATVCVFNEMLMSEVRLSNAELTFRQKFTNWISMI